MRSVGSVLKQLITACAGYCISMPSYVGSRGLSVQSGRQQPIIKGKVENVILVGSNGFVGHRILNNAINSEQKILGIAGSAALESTLSQFSNFHTPTTFVWAASKVNPISAEQDERKVELEFRSFENFVEHLSQYASMVQHVIFLSSAGCLYSGSENSFSESDAALGTNRYGMLKKSMEDLLINSGINSTVVRISNIYGPGQRTGRGQGVIGEWIRAIRNEQPITIYGDGLATRDYIYIDDVVRAIYKIIKRPTGGIYNLGFGKSHSLIEILDTMKEFVQLDPKPIFLPRRSTDRKSFSLDIRKIRDTFEWEPSYNLREGLQQTFTALEDAPDGVRGFL